MEGGNRARATQRCTAKFHKCFSGLECSQVDLA